MTGEQVRELRSRFGESKELFARRLGVSVFTVMNWEAGRKRPSALALRRLQEVAAEVEYELVGVR